MPVESAPYSGIQSKEQVLSGKQFRPVAQHAEVVHGQLNAGLQRFAVFGPGREIRGEQDASGFVLREQFAQQPDLAGRYALELQTAVANAPQHAGVRVGLDRVIDAVYRLQPLEPFRLRRHAVETVGVGRPALFGQLQQLAAPFGPPGRVGAGWRDRRRLRQFLPGGSEQFVAVIRHDQPPVQALRQPAGLCRLHHEADVQIAGRLAEKMDGLLTKRFQRRSDLVQHRPDAPSHQGHDAGIGRDGHLPYALQLRAQTVHQRRGQHFGIGVQRNGHVALRGGNQVHR